VANHAEMMEKLNQFNVIQNSNSLLRSDAEVKAKQLSEKEEELKYGACAVFFFFTICGHYTDGQFD
jgi:hypothetical protein